MRVLILTPETRVPIQRLVSHAMRSPFPQSHILKVKAFEAPPPGDDPQFSCVVPDGYRCVFTIDQLEHGDYRHLSVSVEEGIAPHPAAVDMLLPEFGFKKGLMGADYVHKEDLGNGRLAISIWEKME